MGTTIRTVRLGAQLWAMAGAASSGAARPPEAGCGDGCWACRELSRRLQPINLAKPSRSSQGRHVIEEFHRIAAQRRDLLRRHLFSGCSAASPCADWRQNVARMTRHEIPIEEVERTSTLARRPLHIVTAFRAMVAHPVDIGAARRRGLLAMIPPSAWMAMPCVLGNSTHSKASA